MIWYPYTQMKTMEEPVLVTDAHGAVLETLDGPLIDSIASFFSGLFASPAPTQQPREKAYPGLWNDLDQINDVIVDSYPGLWLDLP